MAYPLLKKRHKNPWPAIIVTLVVLIGIAIGAWYAYTTVYRPAHEEPAAVQNDTTAVVEDIVAEEVGE